jgi:hypothetical protein
MRRTVKQLLGLGVFLAVAIPVTSGFVGNANAVGCSDPPCGECRQGTFDAHAYTCCGASWDCGNCTVCAN